MSKQQSNQHGFTLIELSFSIIIIGLMVAGFLQAYTIYDAKRKIELTELRMNDIDQAINNYAKINGHLPCPAPMGGRGGGVRFNEEDCGTANGNLRVAGTDGNMVLIGKYPAAELGISNDYMKDVHGNYLIYAVTEASTNASTFANASGAIIVLEKGVEDDPGAANFGEIQLLTTHENVQYVAVSSGSNGYGAYTYNGTQSEVCTDANNDEQENCDGDATFKVSVRSDGENSGIYYDDRILFESNVANLLPQTPASCDQQDSMTIAGDTCPDGWEKVDSFNTSLLTANNPYLDERNSEFRSLEPDIRPYYNIDPETGDYYFTQVITANTQNADIIGTDSACNKTTSNNSQTKCFNKQVTLGKDYIDADGFHHRELPGDNLEEKTFIGKQGDCPNGWKIVNNIKRLVSLRNNGESSSYRVINVICGQ